MTVTNLCVCVSSECVVWTLWMCACAALWAKMSQKSVISVALFASRAEINVFFYCACFKRVWTLMKETLISGWGSFTFYFIALFLPFFYLTVGHFCVCIWSIVSLTLQFLPNDKQIFSKMTHRRASNVH